MRLRTVLTVAAIGSGALFASPAHAEKVQIGVTVGSHFEAVAHASSDHPGETFENLHVVRLGATNKGSAVEDNGTDSVGPVAGTSGAVTYLITATPTGENFLFPAVKIACAKVQNGAITCTQSVGLHTVITVVTGPLDG